MTIPGHMMLAPERTNLMAPLSTICGVRRKGYWCSSLRVGIQASLWCLGRVNILSCTVN